MMNQSQIMKKAEKYNFRYIQILNPFTIYIVSGSNLIPTEECSWYIKYIGGIKPYLLKHKNYKSKKNNKDNYHIQRKFYDLDFLFQSIKRHDRNKLCKFKPIRKPKIDMIFEKIQQGK